MSKSSEIEVDSLLKEDTSMEKRPRKRHKKLIVDVCQQIEFYFSDANLRKDRFLRQEMDKSAEGYVRVDILASFNKIMSMTKDRKIVASAIQLSAILELSKDEKLVRRKEALKPAKFDPDDCTVYVECLPKKADHNWLRRAFSCCGNVVYVSLPRYRSTGDIKGFAFIEFETPEEAERACELMNNPPPDVPGRAGMFPKMRGKKRIVPYEFDCTLMRRDSLSKEQLQQSSKMKLESEVRSDRIMVELEHGEEKVGIADTLLAEVKPTEAERGTQRRKRRLDNEDDKKEMKNEGRDDSKVRKKSNDSEKDTAKVSEREPKDGETEGKDLAQVRKGKKRRRDDKVQEDDRKSARRDGDDGGKSKRQQHDEGKGEAETLAERRLKMIEAGRKMMKRKRSLSEGDMWTVQEEEDVKDTSVEESLGRNAVKKLRGDSNDEDDGEEVKNEGSKQEDMSFGSELEKRKRGRKKKMRQLHEEEEALFLRVLSKREWLDLKQEYLMLQKESLTLMKQSLRNRYSSSARAPLSTGSHKQTKHESSDVPKTKEKKEEEESSKKTKESEVEFIEGTVMKLQCLKSPVSRKEIRELLENTSPIAYIDLPDGESQGFVRFQSTEGARSILQESGAAEVAKLQISLSMIAGEEEKAYWDKLRLDRQNKLNSKQKKKKKRGVTKILQRAERGLPSKEKAHIRFDAD